ncbi:phosphotransferase [Candidatus Woesearchaeota archaeon]|nr:phosphotransferase [Candidatus Woesearchaeota archaeon]
MELEKLKNILKTKKEFADLDAWKFDKIHLGSIGKHTHILSKGGKSYFIKDIKENEANALQVVGTINLESIIRVSYPDLLEKKVLVAEYVHGKPIKTKKLSVQLIRDFTEMQNRLNHRTYWKRNHLSGNKFSDKDDGFFKKGYASYFISGYKNIIKLRTLIDHPIINKYIQLVHYLKRDKTRIINDASGMPFAWQHHDFREDNIIQSKRRQIIVDWGSSYGYGPFMFDLAPFLLRNKRTLDNYIKNSDICKTYKRRQVERWVYVAAAIRLMAALNYYFENIEEKVKNKEKTINFLEYEYDTYKILLIKSST